MNAEWSAGFMLAWLIYLLAVAAMQLLVVWATSALPWAALRTVLRLSALGIFITPALIQGQSEYWAPAFMAALMVLINGDSDAGMLLLLDILMVVLALLLIAFIYRLWQHYRRPG